MAVFETWLKSDLQKAVQVKSIQGNLFSADNAGNLIGVVITNGGSPAEITGNVTAYVIRADGATVVVEGSLSGNRASVTLPASAYAVVGQASIVIKVGTTTVGACTIYVYRSTTDTIVDPGEVIPSITELLEKIDEMEQGTAAANTAAQNANTAATSATTAASKIDNMTVEASRLPESASPTAQISEVSGHKHIVFGIPQGVTQVEFDDLSEQVSDLEVQKSPAIYEEIASGSIATFTDGADGMPLKNLSVAIEPVQDLHGQDSPYPAGGGKNLLPNNLVSGSINGISYTVNNDGSVKFAGTSNASTTIDVFSGRIELVAGQAYTVSGVNIQLNGTATKSGQLSTVTFTANEGDYISYAWYYFANGATVNETYYPMIEKGSTKTDFAPYSNICPISGWDGVTVTRTGKNLLSFSYAGGTNNGVTASVTEDRRISLSGTSTGNAIFTLNSSYKLREGSYLLSGHPGNNPHVILSILEYLNDTYTGIVMSDTGSGVSFESKGEEYTYTVRIVVYAAAGALNNFTVSPMVQLASVADSSFAPYKGYTTYSIPFPQAAGTVYGGTLTIHQDGSGELVVDRAKVTVSDLNVNVNFKIGTYSCFKRFVLPHQSTSVSYNEKHGAIASFGIEGVAYFGSDRSNEVGSTEVNFGITTNGESLSIYDTDLTLTDTTFMEKYGNQQVCYPLASPVTYQLTNQQVIDTLKGNNVLWSSTGTVSIEYPADTRLFIEKKIAELQALILENINNS